MNLLFFPNKELQTSATGAGIEELEYASNLFEWILNSSMHTFVLMFFCLKTSKHPQNTTSANNAVIPGQDQGSCLKNSTRPAIKQKTYTTDHYHKIPGPSQE